MSDKSSKVTPDYLAARREWLERYGEYIAQAKNWRAMAFGSLLIAAMFGAGLVYEAQRVKVEPYVVAVDKLGESVRLAQAVQTGAAAQPVVTHVIAHWLVAVRERISDVRAERATVDEAYKYVTQDSAAALNAYFAANNPFEAVNNVNLGSRTVQIQSALPLGNPTPKGGSYQVNWTETDYTPQGAILKEQRWTGIIQYALLSPKEAGADTQQVLDNPFGVYITSFQWQKTL
jgi:type IV secretion system protein VirB5